jgi:hypothetical protein
LLREKVEGFSVLDAQCKRLAVMVLYFQDARTNPALFLAEEKKASAGGKVVLDDGGQGKEDKKEQRRKKASCKSSSLN